MDIMMMVPADFAASNDRGKFTLVGAGFTEIRPPKYPYIHNLMFLFVRLKITNKDSGKNRIIVRLIGEKGPLFQAQFDVDVQHENHTSNEKFLNIPCQLTNLKFEEPGQYNFEVEVNGDTKSQTLSLVRLITNDEMPKN